MTFSTNTYNVTLDIKRHHGYAPKILSVRGDTANVIVASITENGTAVDLTDKYVRVVYLRSDGKIVLPAVTQADAPASAGKLTIEVPNNAYRDGDNLMELQILAAATNPEAGDVLSTTSRLLIRARNCQANNDAIEASNEVTALQAYLYALDNMEAVATTLPAGSNATVNLEQTGTPPYYKITFGIPRGADGEGGSSITNISYANGGFVFTFSNGTSLSVALPDLSIQLYQLSSEVQRALANGNAALVYLASLDAGTILGNNEDSEHAAKQLTKANVLEMYAMKGASAEGRRSGPRTKGIDDADAVYNGYINVVGNAISNASAYSTYFFRVTPSTDSFNSAKVRVNSSNFLCAGFVKQADLTATSLSGVLGNLSIASNVSSLPISNVHMGQVFTFPVSASQDLTIPTGYGYVVITTWHGTLSPGDTGYSTYYSEDIEPTISLTVYEDSSGGDDSGGGGDDPGGDDPGDDTPSEGRVDGAAGFVPAPRAHEIHKFLRGDGTWATPAGGGGGGTDYSEDIAGLQGDVSNLQDDVGDLQNDIAALNSEVLNHKPSVKAVYTSCRTRATGASPNASTETSKIKTDNDIVFVGDELWLSKKETMVSPAPEGASTNERRDIRRMKLINGVWTQIDSTLRTDFGHWNSVDYCAENDCLVFGNGGNDPGFTQTTGNWFAVIKNPKTMWTDYEYVHGYVLLKDFAIKYNWEDEETKVNAVWGSSNLGKNDIVYVHSVVSGGASIITKVQLATDSNGDFVYETVTENGISVKRGSYIVLGKVTNAQYVGAGGMDFHGDTLYIGNGNERGFALMSISDYNTKFVKTPYYPAYNGTDRTVAISGSTQGIVVDNNYVWMYSNDSRDNTGNGFLVQYYNNGFDNGAPSSGGSGGGGSAAVPDSDDIVISDTFSNPIGVPQYLSPGDTMTDVALLVDDINSQYLSASSAAATYLAKNQGVSNSGKLLGVGSTGAVAPVEMPDLAEASSTTLTILSSEWSNGSVTKTVTGMTTDAIVFYAYSDTEGAYTMTQGTDALTITTTDTPPATLTVDVAWITGTVYDDTVRVSLQNLTSSQKAQARDNIEAVWVGDIPKMRRMKSCITTLHQGYTVYPTPNVVYKNRIKAFYNAYLHGADMIECDARKTSDGVWVCWHYEQVPATNGAVIAETPYANISTLVDKIEDVLDLAYHTGLQVNIDMKTLSTSTLTADAIAVAEEIATLVAQHGMRGRVVYATNGAAGSGLPQVVNSIIAIDPEARFIDTAGRWAGIDLSSIDNYKKRLYGYVSYSSGYSSTAIGHARNTGCMLALSGISTQEIYATAMAYNPDMVEFEATADFNAIKDGYFDTLKAGWLA